MILGAGLSVGALTGFIGVGGGSMIVPVLTLLLEVRLPPRGRHIALAGSTAVGALAGTAIATRLPQQALAKGFAVIVTLVALILLGDTLLLGGPPGS